METLSSENCREWNHKTEKGFREFCEKQWHFDLEAQGVWYADNVHVNAGFYASVDVEVCNSDAVRTELKELREDNPFTSAEAICSHFDKKLEKELSADFDWYVSCEEYYPPVAEEYDSNFDYLIAQFCTRYGFELISYECDGETSEYIQN